MELVTGFLSKIAPWIGILPLAFFSFIPAFYLFSSARPRIKRVPVVCPESGKQLKVRLRINIFLSPKKVGKGLNVVSCPSFSGKTIACTKECVFGAKAQQTHRTAGKRYAAKNSILVLP